MLPKSVHIRELGPREGFQTTNAVIPTDKKLALIDALSETGIKDIEITSFVRPDRVPQMADAEEVVKRFKKVAGINYSALYLNEQGFKKSIASDRLFTDGWIYIAASETFLKKNNNITIKEVIDGIPKWLLLFKESKVRLHGVMISTAFGCSYEGDISDTKVISILSDVVSKVKDFGGSIKEISLADTVGLGNPRSVRELVSKCKDTFKESEITLHLHDTRGTGIANVYAGLLEGVSCFDASVGGMGGCPFAKGAAGNVCTEDVVNLCEELGIKTGINLDKYVLAAKLAENIVGMPLPGKLYKAWNK